MSFVTVIHFVQYSSLLDSSTITTSNLAMVSLLSALSSSAINTFALISGWFIKDTVFSWKKVIRLWVSLVCLNVICLVVSVLLGIGKISAGACLRTFFPLVTIHYWYIDLYFILYLLIPYLTLFLDQMDGRSYRRLIIGMGLLITSMSLNPFCNESSWFGDSRSILVFIWLLMIGNYIRNYKSQCGLVTLYAGGGSLLLLTFINFRHIDLGHNVSLVDWYSALPVVFSLCVFELFSRVKLTGNGLKSFVAHLSACSLFVYLVQENEIMRSWFWTLIDIPAYASSPVLPLILWAYVLVFWILAVILSFLINNLFRWIDSTASHLLKMHSRE